MSACSGGNALKNEASVRALCDSYKKQLLLAIEEKSRAALADPRLDLLILSLVDRLETLDGMKFYLRNPEAGSKPNAAESWLLLRASGTEPLMRVYSESCSPASVSALLDAGRRFVMGEGA